MTDVVRSITPWKVATVGLMADPTLKYLQRRKPPDKQRKFDLSDIPVIELKSQMETAKIAKLYMAKREGGEELLKRIQDYYRTESPGMLYSSDSFEVIADTGASCSVSFDKRDFVDGEIKPLEGLSMTGIASSLEVKGVGTIEWVVYDDSGQAQTIRMRGYYIPEMKARLFSPQQYLEEQEPAGEFVVRAKEARFRWKGSACVTMAYQAPSMLPVMRAFHQTSLDDSKNKLLSYVLQESNENLTATQKLLLQWHYRLGHLSFDWIKWLA